MEKNLNSLIRSIFYIAVPMILSNVSAPLLGLVDTAIVGRIGTTEIGSVAIGATTFSLIFSSFVFLRIWSCVRVSAQKRHRKKNHLTCFVQCDLI